MLESEYYLNKNFYVLFDDAVNNLEESDSAIDEDDYAKVFRYGRASIIASTLLLECCANCCIDTLKLGKSFREDIDKLPALSKYELFLSYHNKEKSFDRGCQEIQNASELKYIRDLIVHPKVRRAKWEKANGNFRHADIGETKILKYPNDIEIWDRNYALMSLRIICAFLDHFFLNLCCFDAEITKKILIDYEEFTINPQVGVGTPNEWEKPQVKWQLRLGFIGIESQNAKNL